MSKISPLTKHEQLALDRERLAIFVREIKHYKTRWGIPPDRIAFRDAWKATQLQTFCLHNNTTQGVSK